MSPLQKQSSLIIGRQPILEALKEGNQLERIFLQKNTIGDIIGEIKKFAAELQVPVNVVPVEKLNSLSRSNHQGVIAIRSFIRYLELQDVIDQCISKGDTPLFFDA